MYVVILSNFSWIQTFFLPGAICTFYHLIPQDLEVLLSFYLFIYCIFKIWNRLFHISISFSSDCKPAAYFNNTAFEKNLSVRSLNWGCQLQSEFSCMVGLASASLTVRKAQPCRWWLHWALPVSRAGRCSRYGSSAGAWTHSDPAESTSNTVSASFKCSDFVSKADTVSSSM